MLIKNRLPRFCHFKIPIGCRLLALLQLLVLLSLCIFNEDLYAQPESSIVALVGRGICGSGFYIGEGRVITNAHVAKSVCEFGKCPKLEVFQGTPGHEGFSKKLEFGGITLERLIPSLDLALLQVQFKSAAPEPLTVSDSNVVQLSDAVSVAGFPLCKGFVRSEGTVVERRVDSFLTSATISKGSSGSAVLNRQGQVVGIITQSATIYEGLSGLLLGTSHRGRAVDAKYITLLVNGDYQNILSEEVKSAFAFYKENVSGKRSFDRLIPGIYFSMLVEKISERLRLQGSDPIELKLLLSSLDEFPQRGLLSNSTIEDVELLSIAYALEGPSDFLQPRATKDAFLQSLKIAGRSNSHLEKVSNLLSDFERSRYSGIYPYLLMLFVIILGLGIVWAFSLGFLFATLKGSIFRRGFWTAVSAVALWPLPIIIILLYRHYFPARAEKAQ